MKKIHSRKRTKNENVQKNRQELTQKRTFFGQRHRERTNMQKQIQICENVQQK